MLFPFSGCNFSMSPDFKTVVWNVEWLYYIHINLCFRDVWNLEWLVVDVIFWFFVEFLKYPCLGCHRSQSGCWGIVSKPYCQFFRRDAPAISSINITHFVKTFYENFLKIRSHSLLCCVILLLPVCQKEAFFDSI